MVNRWVLTLLERVACRKCSVSETRHRVLPSRTSHAHFSVISPTSFHQPGPRKEKLTLFHVLSPKSACWHWPDTWHPPFIFCNFLICPWTDEALTFPYPLGSPFRSAWRRSHRLHTNVGPQRQCGGRPPAPAPAPGRSRGRAAFCALSPRKI